MPEQISFQQLAERHREVMQYLGVTVNESTVDVALMQMMSALGELSTLCFRNATSLSPFERSEVAGVLGRLAVSLSAVGEAFEVPIGSAALQALDDQLKQVGGAARPAQAGPPAPPPQLQQLQQQQQKQQQQADVESFFNYLDQLASEPRASFEQAQLRWVAPAADGKLEEIIPNGARTPVRYEDFPRFLQLAERYRPASTSTSGARVRGSSFEPSVSPPASAPAPVAAPAANVVNQMQSAIVTKAPGYDPDREAQMFSPTHFAAGLFSPMARPTEYLPSEVRPPTAIAAAPSAGPLPAAFARAAPVPPPKAPSQPPAPDHLSPIGAGLSTLETIDKDFNQAVELLQTGQVSGQQVAQLGLTFSVPDGPRVVELVKDGLQVHVTAANVDEFLRLVREYHQQPRAAVPQNRVHRTMSVRRFEVPEAREPPQQAADSFSPTHFTHGLFAPFEKKTAYYVDCDESDKTLPPFLRQSSQQQQQQQQQQPTAQQQPQRQSTVSQRHMYLDAVQSSDMTSLKRILQEVRQDPNALSTYGVTYCVPSTLEPTSTVEERRSGMHALFPGSASMEVTPDQQNVFLALVRQYFPDVLP